MISYRSNPTPKAPEPPSDPSAYDEAIRNLWRSGHDTADIARRLGLDRHVIPNASLPRVLLDRYRDLCARLGSNRMADEPFVIERLKIIRAAERASRQNLVEAS